MIRLNYNHHRCGRWDIPEQYHDTHWVGELTQDWIERQAESDRPWFCWASFQDPHEPFVCPEPWFSRVDMTGVEPFEGERPGELDDKPAFYREGPIVYREEGQPAVPCVMPSPRWDEQAKTALQATLGMNAFIDDRVGRMLHALERTGQLENTIVLFTSDHGEMHGHHGYWGKGLTAYEDCQRVPLLVWGPGRIQPRGPVEALANLVDLPRTILGWAGVETPVGMQGAQLGPVCAGEADAVQDATLIECRATESSVYQQTLVTDRHKLVVYRDDPQGELYDLHDDPEQYVNLWADPAHQSLRHALLHRLARHHMEREGRVHRRESFA